MGGIIIGRARVQTPVEVQVEATQGQEGISGPHALRAYRVRSRASGADAQNIMDRLEKEMEKPHIAVHVEDLDDLIPRGKYIVRPNYRKPGGGPKQRPAEFTLLRKPRPHLQFEAEDHDVRHIGSTADATASEEKRIRYTPDATARTVLRIGSSLVLHLRLEANANDFSGLGNNGTANGGLAFAAAKVGNGGDFDGVNDYVSVPDHATLKPTAELTLEAWVKPANVNAGTRYIVDKVKYRLHQSGADVVFTLIIGGATKTVTASGVLAAGTFAHVVGSYDGHTMRVLVDGIEKASLAVTGSVDTSTDAVAVGAISGGASGFVVGILDEVRVHNRGLVPGEAKERYDLTTGGSRPSNDYRAPLDVALDLWAASWRTRVRVKAATTTTVRLRAVWRDKDGAAITGGTGSWVSPGAAGAWLWLDLGSFVVPTADDRGNSLHIEVDDPSNTNVVDLDVAEVTPA